MTNYVPSPGTVVYQREPGGSPQNQFWVRRRNYVFDTIPSSFPKVSIPSSQANPLQVMADFERKKEQDFLNKFFPSQSGDLVQDFNILLQGEKNYEQIQERIKKAIDGIKSVQTNEYIKGTAPNFEAVFGSYLETDIQNALIQFRNIFTSNLRTDLKALEKTYNDIIDTAILNALDRMVMTAENDELHGSARELEQANQLIQSDPYLRTQFLANMRQAIGGNPIHDLFEALRKKKRRSDTTIRKLVREKLTVKSRTTSIGGNVLENTRAALAQAVNGISGNNGSIEYRVNATPIHGEQVKTDYAILFSADTTIDTKAAAEALNDTLTSHHGTLLEATKKIEEFYQSQQDAMKELYTVFVNAKNYSLGINSRSVDTTEEGTLEELPGFLETIGFSVGNAEDFLAFAYNTGQGAIHAGSREAFMDEYTNVLKAAAAKLMFDDYQSLGAGDAHSIHLYMLSGVYVPASAVFQAAANAVNSAKSEASIQLPGPTEDPGERGWGQPAPDEVVKSAIIKHWNEEYERARKASSWKVKFTLNIKQLLTSKI